MAGRSPSRVLAKNRQPKEIAAMNTPHNPTLMERRPGHSFTSGRSRIPGELILSEVRLGDQVSLHHEKVEIVARVATINGDEMTGEIVAFSEPHGRIYAGMSLGDPISFREANVFICT